MAPSRPLCSADTSPSLTLWLPVYKDPGDDTGPPENRDDGPSWGPPLGPTCKVPLCIRGPVLPVLGRLVWWSQGRDCVALRAVTSITAEDILAPAGGTRVLLSCGDALGVRLPGQRQVTFSFRAGASWGLRAGLRCWNALLSMPLPPSGCPPPQLFQSPGEPPAMCDMGCPDCRGRPCPETPAQCQVPVSGRGRGQGSPRPSGAAVCGA